MKGRCWTDSSGVINSKPFCTCACVAGIQFLLSSLLACKENILKLPRPLRTLKSLKYFEFFLHQKTTQGFSCESLQHAFGSWITFTLRWATAACRFSPESRSLFLPFQVNVDDTIEMLPKSRRALTIQEIAALARSSLHGECYIQRVYERLCTVKMWDHYEVLLLLNP